MAKNNEANNKPKSVVREYAEAIIIALIIALFIRTFIVQAFKIPSGSMIPTLLIGDHILVNKFIFGIRNPFSGKIWVSIGDVERNDIVVFKFPKNPDQDFIKRVIGLPGDTIEIINKKVYVNGEALKDEFAIHLDRKIISMELQKRDNLGPVKVPINAYFVMGDNRDNSHDSRFWGFVDDHYLKGKAFIHYWSWDKQAFKKYSFPQNLFDSVRWNRIGKLIH